MTFLEGQYWDVLIYYISGRVVTAEQYLVYTNSGIVSAVGGALGMFLGWSFYGFYDYIINTKGFKRAMEWLKA